MSMKDIAHMVNNELKYSILSVDWSSESRLILFRLNKDGTLDTSFNSTGYHYGFAPFCEHSRDFIIDKDNRYVVIAK